LDSRVRAYARSVERYIFNSRAPDAATGLLHVGLWSVDPDEHHGNAFASGDLS